MVVGLGGLACPTSWGLRYLPQTKTKVQVRWALGSESACSTDEKVGGGYLGDQEVRGSPHHRYYQKARAPGPFLVGNQLSLFARYCPSGSTAVPCPGKPLSPSPMARPHPGLQVEGPEMTRPSGLWVEAWELASHKSKVQSAFCPQVDQ